MPNPNGKRLLEIEKPFDAGLTEKSSKESEPIEERPMDERNSTEIKSIKSFSIFHKISELYPNSSVTNENLSMIGKIWKWE